MYRPLRHPNHKKPITRRDFLAQGFIGGAAMVVAPSLFGLFKSQAAYAQAAIQCNLSTGAGRIPFVCFDLAGGANIAGSNVLVGGPGGQLDLLTGDGYSKLGLPNSMTPGQAGQVDAQFGLRFHSDSAFLRGMLSKTSAATRANTNGTVFCARSDNDTGNNPHNPMYGINKAGADGNLVTLIGTEPSDSGGNSQAPMSMIDPAARPTKVDSPSDVTGLVDTGRLAELLAPQDAAAVMSAVEQISDSKLGHMTEDAIVEQLIHCGYVESTALVSAFGNPALLNPLTDPDITTIFSGGELNQGTFRKTASVMKLAVNGFAGAGTIELGGYDYHDGTRATGETRDFDAGVAMGAVLEYAARRGQQLMMYVFSDGALDSDGSIDNSADGRGKGRWRGDNQSTAAVFMLVYDPAGRPPLMSPARQQLGYYRMSGDVETSATPVSNNVTLLAETVVLNYMALHNDVGRFTTALPSQGLGSNMNNLIAFAPIRPTPP
jgi:hypothetical protein